MNTLTDQLTRMRVRAQLLHGIGADVEAQRLRDKIAALEKHTE